MNNTSPQSTSTSSNPQRSSAKLPSKKSPASSSPTLLKPDELQKRSLIEGEFTSQQVQAEEEERDFNNSSLLTSSTLRNLSKSSSLPIASSSSHLTDAHTSHSTDPISPVMNRNSRHNLSHHQSQSIATSNDVALGRQFSNANGTTHVKPPDLSSLSHSKSASSLHMLPSATNGEVLNPTATNALNGNPMAFAKRPSLALSMPLTHSSSSSSSSHAQSLQNNSSNNNNININNNSTTTSITTTSSSSSTTFRHHIVKTALWISLAIIVAIIVSFVRGKKTALEFTTAYIVEYSLSVDNLFVFLLIFRYFKVPSELQESVLTYGIVGAMLLRGIMIVCGKALIEKFEWISIIFAAFLIYSAVKLLLEDDDDENESNLDSNRIVKFARVILPVSERYTGNRFFIYENSKILATPLMVVLITIELSDVVFALDSVPAVLGLSNDTFVIYTSNILAIMGLRSLFFILSSSIANFRFLKHALATVLGFIGIKMIAGWLGFDIGTGFSLVFVACCLGLGVICSMAFPVKDGNVNGNCDVSNDVNGVNKNQSNLNNV